MEEGPEPQEWVERTVEHHHHEHEHAHAPPEARAATTVPAITAALLAVLAAVGSLLSGHEANQAILHQTQATDRWAYFQANSTKGHLYEVGRDIVGTLAEARGSASSEKIRPRLEEFSKQVQKYEQRKDEQQEKAQELEHESDREFRKHHAFAEGIASFQVGIVLASISILVRFRTLWVLSVVAGLVGIAFLVLGLFH